MYQSFSPKKIFIVRFFFTYDFVFFFFLINCPVNIIHIHVKALFYILISTGRLRQGKDLFLLSRVFTVCVRVFSDKAVS